MAGVVPVVNRRSSLEPIQWFIIFVLFIFAPIDRTTCVLFSCFSLHSPRQFTYFKREKPNNQLKCHVTITDPYI